MQCMLFAKVSCWPGSTAENMQIFSDPFLTNKSLEQLAGQSTLRLGVCVSQKEQPPAYPELELHSSRDEPPCHY